MIGNKIYNLAKILWPINRSITGDGNRKTLKILKSICNDLKIKEIKSGTKAFDWVVPNEWKINDAWIKDSKGKKIVNFKNNNLHVINYSESVKRRFKQVNSKKNYTQCPINLMQYHT